MNRVVKAVLWAIPPIILLVVLPRLVLAYVPTSYVSSLRSYADIDLSSLVNGLTIFGIVFACLSALQTWAYDWSIAKPVASSLHVITSYVLLLFLIGIGNPLTFGTTRITMSLSSFGSSLGPSSITIDLVSTFLAIVVGIAVALKILQRGMKFSEAKKLHALDLAEEAGPSQAAPTVTTVVTPSAAFPRTHNRFCTNCGKPPVEGAQFSTEGNISVNGRWVCKPASESADCCHG